MTAARTAPAISPRCASGEHNRCPGILPGTFCDCSCGHPATVNVRAASAVVLHDRAAYDNDRMFHAQARELLDMLGLVDDGQIVADDVRSNNLGGAHQATGGPTSERPLRTVDGDLDDDVASTRPLTTPPGLRVLPPLPATPPQQPTRPKAKTKTPTRTAPAASAQPTPTETAPKKRRAVAVCGTTGGYARHKRMKEPICDPCREAKNGYWRERDAAQRVEQGRSPATGRKRKAACGTRSGYMRHLRLNEATCPACRAANNRSAANRNPEETRLLAAGVNPEAAAVLANAAPKPTPKVLPPKRIAPVPPPIVHGTPEGWQAHHDRGALPPCEACETAVAPPPKPAGQDVAELLAKAQRSRNTAIATAAARAVGLLVRVQAATAHQLADGRLAERLAAALDDVSRAQARASSRSNGDT